MSAAPEEMKEKIVAFLKERFTDGAVKTRILDHLNSVGAGLSDQELQLILNDMLAREMLFVDNTNIGTIYYFKSAPQSQPAPSRHREKVVHLGVNGKPLQEGKAAHAEDKWTRTPEEIIQALREYILELDGECFKPRDFLSQRNDLYRQEIINETLVRNFCEIVAKAPGDLCSKCAHGRFPILNPPPDYCIVKAKPAKLKAKAKKEEFTIYQALELPNWGVDGRIVAPITLEKNVGGKRFFLQYVVYLDSEGKVQTDPIAEAIFIPSETAPTPRILDLLKMEFELPKIYQDFREAIARHVYFTEDLHYDLVALGAMSSYFREIFDSYPYFDFYSVMVDVGKTHAMKALIWHSYSGFLAFSQTEAVLFRAIDESHSTIGIDEVGKLFKDIKKNQEILTLLLCGYNKGLKAYRMDMDAKPPRPIGYDAFGLKAFTRKESIPRDLESRSITIHMMSCKGRKKVEQHITPEEFSDNRDLMYAYRVNHWEEVKKIYEDLRVSFLLEGRISELYYPLLTIAKLISSELYEKILSYARGDEQQKSILKQDEWFIELISLLHENGYDGDIRVITIRDELRTRIIAKGEDEKEVHKRITSKSIISKLNGIGLKRSPKFTNGYIHYAISKEHLEQWYRDICPQNIPTPTIGEQPHLSSFSRAENGINKPHSEEVKNEAVEGEKQPPKMRLSEVNLLCEGKVPIEGKTGITGSQHIEKMKEFADKWQRANSVVNSLNLSEFLTDFLMENNDVTPFDAQEIARKIFKITPIGEDFGQRFTDVNESQQQQEAKVIWPFIRCGSCLNSANDMCPERELDCPKTRPTSSPDEGQND